MNYLTFFRFAGLAACAAFALAPGRALSAPIDRIGAYAGTWNTHVVHYKTRYSKARTETAKLQNLCRHSAGYFACEQVVDGSLKALLVFTYDRQHGIYHSQVFPADGSPGGSGTLVITGNTWTYPWQDKDGAKTVYVRIVNTFLDARTIRFRQEFSYDRKHWTLTATGLERRV